MVIINFGQSKLSRVTKGSLGGKFVIPGDVATIKHKIPTMTLKLNGKREALLRAHAKGHTKRHMDYMRQMMLLGVSYKEAHQRAQQFIGR